MTTQINGISLTQNAIQTLLSLQAEDNGLLRSNIKDLTLIVKRMTIEESFNTDNAKRALSDIAFLFSLCDIFESLISHEEDEQD